MIKHIRLFTGLFFLSILAIAQDLSDKTLLSIDNKTYDAGTFMRTFSKNLDIVQDESQKDVDNYLELYIDYRLKLEQAYELGLHEKKSYQKELANYRATLAQGYLTDQKVTEELVQEAYQRMKKELKGSHILVKVGKAASPEDSLKAWNKIQAIKKQLDEGADFGQLARDLSEGPSAKVSGDLGWFSAFRMVYTFENAAYNTPVGSYSDVFRTDYGYHIVKIYEEREARGQVTAAHIMTFDKPGDTEKTAEKRIKDIYNQLQETGRFEELAREFSDDIQTAANGGKLKKFGTGGLNAPAFEEAAFNLKNPGDISSPVKSRYGWHIIKLIEKHPVPSFEKQEVSLRDRIKRSPRARQISDSFLKGLRDYYEVSFDDAVAQQLNELIGSEILDNKWVNDTEKLPQDLQVLSLKNFTYKSTDFFDYIERLQKKNFNSYSSKKEKVNDWYQSFVNDKVSEYYEKNLEQENDEFAFIYNEYKEGLLLFDLMETKIWGKAKEDTLGQKQFYNAHKDNYIWSRRLDVTITQNTSEQVALEVKQMLESGTDLGDIKDAINIENRTRVMISSGVVEDTYHKLPNNFKATMGVSDIYFDEKTGFYKVVRVNEILEPSLKSFEEAKGAVISDYQQQLEKEWMNGLRKGRDIKIYKRVYKKVKRALEKK